MMDSREDFVGPVNLGNPIEFSVLDLVKNIIHLLDDPYFEIIRHDITLPLYVEVDEIYNLTCSVH